jgi:mycofactocin system glycosyltransferase
MRQRRLAIDTRVTFFDAGRIVIGGTPRRLSRLGKPAQQLMACLRRAGHGGLVVSTESELLVARVLIDRGLAHPLPLPPDPDADSVDIDVIIPTRGRVAQVERLLATLDRPDVVVVDDATEPGDALAAVVERHRGRLVRHIVNTGPAGARNSGLGATRAPFIAFLDSDCVPSRDWPQSLLSHFDDPHVAMVASRIVHRGAPSTSGSFVDRLIDDYETCHGALDAGEDSCTVGPKSRVRGASSAAIVLRRSAVEDLAFDPDLRIGEDLDLIWRLSASGWVVRHEPSVVVEHESMTGFLDWLRRRYEYGTFAGPINQRHPGSVQLAMEWWAVAIVALVVTGHSTLAASVGASRLAYRWWSIRSVPDAPAIALTITRQEIAQVWDDLSQTVRGVGWPVGAALVLGSTRSPAARRASVIVFAPLAWELMTHRPRSSALSHTLLGALRTAATGTGIAMSLVRSRDLTSLLPRVNLPKVRRHASKDEAGSSVEGA